MTRTAVGRVQDARYHDLSWAVYLEPGEAAVELVASVTHPRVPLALTVPIEPRFLAMVRSRPSRLLTEPVLSGCLRVAQAGELNFAFPEVFEEWPEDAAKALPAYVETPFESRDSPFPGGSFDV